MAQLHIAVLNSAEVVSIPLDQLPEDCEEVLEVLKAEVAPVNVWMDVALAYISNGRPDQYVRVLQEATSREADEFYGDRFRAERVEVLCSLAGYHLSKAQHMRDPQRKGDLQTAESYGIRARTLDKREMLPFLIIGVVAMARNDLNGARREFEVAVIKKNQGKSNMIAYVALASVYFQEGKYNEALAYYKHILQTLGSAKCPPEVRDGMAACYFRLGKFDFAKKAFLRTLELYPNTAEALRGLAVIILREHSDHPDQAISEAKDYLVRAYKADPLDPATLIMASHLLLLKGSYEEVSKLAEVACETAVQDNIKAEALTLLGRSMHAKGKTPDAFTQYAHAQRLYRTLPLPHFGLAQIYVGKEEIRNAVTELENMLKTVPGSVDALKLLAHLYPQLSTKSVEKLQIIQDAAKRQHTDPNVWAVLGELLGPMDAKGSLEAYKKALDKFNEPVNGGAPEFNGGAGTSSPSASAKKEIPPKILNDAAVMFSKAGEYAEAQKLVKQAIAAVEESGCSESSAQPNVTLRFNLGRLHEASGNVKEASKLYKAILSDHSEYIDAYIRLSYINHHQGNFSEAQKWCKKALKVKPKDPTATVVLAGMYISDRNWHDAKRLLDSLVKGEYTTDPYALLCMGTLIISSAPTERRKDKDKDSANNFYLKALEYYQKAIENSPQNIYAANGIGAALAEMGDLKTAQEIFVRVKEAAASQGKYLEMPNVWINLANIHLAFGDYDSAIQVYENALARFYEHSNPTLLIYLARSHYDKGNLTDAKATLLKAQHLVPNDYTLKFNTALVMQEHGVRTLDKRRLGDDTDSVEDCKKAGEDIARALRFFSALRKLPPENTGIDAKKLITHMQFCTDALKRSKNVRDEVEARFKEAEVKRQQTRRVREEFEAKHRMAKQEKERKKEMEEARAAEEVRKQSAKLERIKQNWAEEAALKKAARKGDSSKVGRKRKIKTDDDGFIVHEEEIEAEKRDRRRKKGRMSDRQQPMPPEHHYEPEMEMEVDMGMEPGMDQPQMEFEEEPEEMRQGQGQGQDDLAAAGLLSDEDSMEQGELPEDGDLGPGGDGQSGQAAETAPEDDTFGDELEDKIDQGTAKNTTRLGDSDDD
ncbi:hypothetical protein BSKO_03494 [Bryopsis sp. KO-2023]|nr:hypothetical protein BSKO_03494 [Bryopsis sp. KO-2023]